MRLVSYASETVWVQFQALKHAQFHNLATCMNYTIVRTLSNLQIEVMVGHLRNTALMLREQKTSRHMNFRMGGLMFDSKFNSKQSFTWDLAKEILHLLEHLSSEKGFY